MCITLNEITHDNVNSLSKIRYSHVGKEFKSDVTYCSSYEEVIEELQNRQQRGNVHSWNFLVLTFHVTRDEISQVVGLAKDNSLSKLIFTQESLEIAIKEGTNLSFWFCCSLAKEFVGLVEKGSTTDQQERTDVEISLFNSAIEQAHFTQVGRFRCSGTTFNSLYIDAVSESIVKFYRSKLRHIRYVNSSWVPSNAKLFFGGSVCHSITIKIARGIEQVAFENCEIRDNVTLFVRNKINELVIHHCMILPEAILDFETALVVDRFDLELNRLPKTMLLPNTIGATEKSFHLPQSTRVRIASFITPELTDEEVSKLKMQQPMQENLGDQDFREGARIDRLMKNLEKAYILAKLVDRQREALDILERILVEKRKRLLLERAVEIADNSQSKLENKIKQVTKYVELTHIKNLAHDEVVGYFINLKKIMRTFLVVVAFFSSVFISFPTILKIGTDEWGNVVTLQQLSVLERVLNSIYFTVVTLSTLGYGDIQPLGWGKLVAALLSLVGLLLSGIVLVVILRRYSR